MDEQRARTSAPTAVEPPSPDGLTTPSSPSVSNEPNLPPIAADADDLKAIKTAVDDAAAVGGGLWLSYLFALFYLAVAAGAVTHADLFLENPVKLPFLNIELPLLAFFFVTPILFVIVHAYTLVHLVMLSDKAKRFHEVLHKQIGGADRAATRAGLQRQLPSNIFVQFLAGPPDIRASLFGSLLRGIAWSTLVVAPVLLLLLFQIQFLPFHSSFITWAHRLTLLADLALVWWLWREILSGRAADGRRLAASRVWIGLGLALSVCAVLLSWTAATFPGERQDSLAKWDRSGLAASLHEWVFNSHVDSITRRRWLPLSSTLVLTGTNIYEGLKIDDPDKMKGRDYIFRARGRDLKGAILDFASLPKVDFTGAQLQGAALNFAQLQGASLAGAQLQGASLLATQLQGADLDSAELQGATLGSAQLQGARLVNAQLQGATLYKAQLQGAALVGAWLQGASLGGAQLQGASLKRALLQGADLDFAQLQGAILGGATLQGATLDSAQLQGAALVGAELQGASLASAQLQGARLDEATLEATDLSGAYLWRTNPGTRPPTVSAIRMSGEIWEPGPWDDKAYQALRTTIESLVYAPESIESIQNLDCSSSAETLASCDPSATPPPEAAAWRKALESASVDKKTYDEALAKVLTELVCSEGDWAIYVVRGPAFEGRLRAASGAAIDLIDDLTNKDSKDCPVSASLTNDDKAQLLRIKQDAIKKPEG